LASDVQGGGRQGRRNRLRCSSGKGDASQRSTRRYNGKKKKKTTLGVSAYVKRGERNRISGVARLDGGERKTSHRRVTNTGRVKNVSWGGGDEINISRSQRSKRKEKGEVHGSRSDSVRRKRSKRA